MVLIAAEANLLWSSSSSKHRVTTSPTLITVLGTAGPYMDIIGAGSNLNVLNKFQKSELFYVGLASEMGQKSADPS